ncbi:MAG: hypothetical protein GWO03_08720, partial [Gammaproteobacteria bacterium]|nr:hypothetical protein [Gammaproteobacteria bacterium]
ELPDITVAQDEEGNWTVTPRPEHYSADSAPMLADAWQSARAMKVERAGPEEAEPDEAAVKLHLAGREEPVVFTIVQREPELVLGRPDLGLRYRLSKSDAEELLELPEPEAADEPPPAPAGAKP